MLIRLRTKVASATTDQSSNDPFLTLGPVKLCCGMRHHGVQCPDGLVMCCLCFNRFPKEKLVSREVEDGVLTYVDVCRECNAADGGW